MRWLGTPEPAQPGPAGSHHPNALHPWGTLIAPSGGWDFGRSAGWFLPALRERAGCPSVETKPPRERFRPCLVRVFQTLKLYLGTHDIVWPSIVQTQDVGIAREYSTGCPPRPRENAEADFSRGNPPFGKPRITFQKFLFPNYFHEAVPALWAKAPERKIPSDGARCEPKNASRAGHT